MFGAKTGTGRGFGVFIFAFSWMTSALRPSMSKIFIRFLLVLCTLICAGQNFAQTTPQHLLDTLVVTGGVLPGYLTASGEQVLRMQLGPAMELRRFSEDGTAQWWRRYIVPEMDWSQSTVVSDGGEGAFMAGGPELRLDGDGMPLLSQFLLHADGSGSPTWSVALEWELGVLDLDGLVPTTRLVRTSDGACIVVISSTEPGFAAVRLTKVAAGGEVLWSRAFSDPLAEAGAAWGNAATILSADDGGGVYLARQELGLAALSVARVNGGGDVLWVRRFSDPAGYAMETYDVALAPSGDLVVLGRLLGVGLPSGGSLVRVAANGTLLRADRYQWELGRRLFVRPNGSFATVKVPWIYLLDDQGGVLRTHAFQEWVIEPHRFVFTMSSMDVGHERLWMQGVLRRILIQFGTQTLRPAFFTHPIDDIQGCKWTMEEGFGFTELEVAAFVREDVNGAVTTDLLPLLSVLPSEIELSTPARYDAEVFCDQAVGIAPLTSLREAGFRLAANPPLQNDEIELLDVAPGTIYVHDLQGRSIWQGESEQLRERSSIPLGGRATGMLLVHWRALDGSSSTVEKVLLP